MCHSQAAPLIFFNKEISKMPFSSSLYKHNACFSSVTQPPLVVLKSRGAIFWKSFILLFFHCHPSCYVAIPLFSSLCYLSYCLCFGSSMFLFLFISEFPVISVGLKNSVLWLVSSALVSVKYFTTYLLWILVLHIYWDVFSCAYVVS